jgi:hypothetical protein
MNTKGIVAIFTTGALAIGLAAGGVAGAAFATDQHTNTHSHSHSHHWISPAVPTNPNTPSHHIQILITPSQVLNLVKDKYDSTLYPNARYEAIPGSYAADIERAGGQSEQFNGRDGNVITIGVAKGDFAANQAAIAKTATLVGGYGSNVKVYEINGGGTYTGDYEVFADGYWFSLTSNLFTSPEVAAPMIQAALQLAPRG